MKTTIIKTLISLSILLSACSDSEVTPIKSETPLNTYMKNVTAGSVEEYSNGNVYSLGYAFVTKKAGTITDLGVSSPQAGTFNILLYDGTTKELLASTNAEITEGHITENPYGFAYGTLAESVKASADQLFYVVYKPNSGDEKFYRPLITPYIFQMKNSFIEFQGGIYGVGDAVPSNPMEDTYYTADIKIKY